MDVWVEIWSHKRGGILYEGDCDRVGQLNSGLHILINGFSTVLLSSSNYCMQCLSAPTRKEIDHAHANRQWLDIGIPSLRNLKRIGRKRVVLWCLLGITSLPLHLFYNSAVFSSISINNYLALSVSESFFRDKDCLNCDNITGPWLGMGVPIRKIWEKAHRGEFEMLTNAKCIEEYAQLLQSKRRNVLLVAADDKFPPPEESAINATRVYAVTAVDSSLSADSKTASDIYEWICSNLTMGNEHCVSKINEIKSVPEEWRVSGINYTSQNWPVRKTEAYPVDYCLSERAEPHCTLQFVPSIAILVTILNLAKAVLILYTVFRVTDEPLLTMGDTVASFLEREDPTTRDMCLLSVKEVKKSKNYFPVGPRLWTAERWRWKDVTSIQRRITTISILMLAVLLVAGLYDYGVKSLPEGTPQSLPDLARLGYGSIDPRTIITFPGSISLIGNALIANVAQPILSFLYFTYNGLFTCMLLGYEWSTYAHHRKGLRVSRASAGSQRSTYFLQLPYRFALPLMALSGILHWLVSQSIFLVAIDLYNYDGAKGSRSMPSSVQSRIWFNPQDGWKSCGYSPIAILNVIILGVCMIIAIIGFGFVPYKPGMNLAGSCSAAISAACHIGEGEIDGAQFAQEKLQWGVTGTNTEGFGHCAFSTKEITFPTPFKMYAGSLA